MNGVRDSIHPHDTAGAAISSRFEVEPPNFSARRNRSVHSANIRSERTHKILNNNGNIIDVQQIGIRQETDRREREKTEPKTRVDGMQDSKNTVECHTELKQRSEAATSAKSVDE